MEFHETLGSSEQGRSLLADARRARNPLYQHAEVSLWDHGGWSFNETPRLSAYVCEILISLDHGPNPMFTAFPARLHDLLFPDDYSTPPNLPKSLADLKVFYDEARYKKFRDELIQYLV